MQDHSKKYSIDYGSGVTIVPPWAYNSITQGTWTLVSASGHIFYFYWGNDTTNAQNDQVDYKVYLSKGTYQFDCWYRKGADRGICSLLIDTVSQGTQDMGGVAAAMQLWTISNIVIAASGIKNVALKVTDKSAGSDYIAQFTHFTFTRTA